MQYLSRRTFLISLAASGLAACQSGGSSGSGATTGETGTTGANPNPSPTNADGTTSPPPSIAPPTTGAATTATQTAAVSGPFWERGGFASVSDEIDATELVVRGEIPTSLRGLYARNGSNPQSGTSVHWFFGDGMVHGVALADGRAVSYRNRWVRTPPFDAGADLMDPQLPVGAPGREIGQANVSVFHHGGRLLASGEVGWPYELTTDELSTVGAYNFGSTDSGPAVLGPNVTAHPKIDPRTGYLHFFGYQFAEPFLQYYVADPSGVLVHSRAIDRPRSAMVHDFAITDRDVVFWDFPAVFSPEAFSSREFPYEWQPELGSQVGHMPLWSPDDGADDATQPTWIDIENGFVFHGTNAWRDGDQIVLDVSWAPELFGAGQPIRESHLRRWTIDTAAGSWKDEQLDELPMEFPTIDPRSVGVAHQRAYYVNATSGPAPEDPNGFVELNGIVARDVASGELDIWKSGPEQQPGEAIFVADDPADPANGAGWLLTYVWHSDDTSSMAIFNSEDVSSGPVAEIDLPQRVPFGFHGTWVPA